MALTSKSNTVSTEPKGKRKFWKRIFSRKNKKEEKVEDTLETPRTQMTYEMDLDDMEDSPQQYSMPAQLNGVMRSEDYGGQSISTRSRFQSDAESTMGGLTLGDTSGFTTDDQSNWNMLGFNGFSTMSMATNDLADDSTYDASFFDHENETGNHHVIEVLAPAGKLGLLMDTPETGFPFVYGIKDWSPLAGSLQTGDMVVSLDDEDVRFCTAIELSKLLSRKSNNKTRKLTIMRKVRVQ